MALCLSLYAGSHKSTSLRFLTALQDASVVLGMITNFLPYVYAASGDLKPHFSWHS